MMFLKHGALVLGLLLLTNVAWSQANSGEDTVHTGYGGTPSLLHTDLLASQAPMRNAILEQTTTSLRLITNQQDPVQVQAVDIYVDELRHFFEAEVNHYNQLPDSQRDGNEPPNTVFSVANAVNSYLVFGLRSPIPPKNKLADQKGALVSVFQVLDRMTQALNEDKDNKITDIAKLRAKTIQTYYDEQNINYSASLKLAGQYGARYKQSPTEIQELKNSIQRNLDYLRVNRSDIFGAHAPQPPTVMIAREDSSQEQYVMHSFIERLDKREFASKQLYEGYFKSFESERAYDMKKRYSGELTHSFPLDCFSAVDMEIDPRNEKRFIKRRHPCASLWKPFAGEAASRLRAL